MQKLCGNCGSSDFRISHFRPFDFVRLLAGQYPVRCKRCQHRSYAFVLLALHYRRRRKPNRT